MRIVYAIIAFSLFLAGSCPAGDFIVEYVKENYRETRLPKSYNPLIYHSIQVTSSAGPKLLILTGDDYNYRKWLRQYIAQGKQFVAQIPDDRDDLFISSYAFELDAKDLHPLNLKQYRQAEEENKSRASVLNLPPEYSEPDAAGDKKEMALQQKQAREKQAREKQAVLEKKKETDRLEEKQARKRLSQQKAKQDRQKQQNQQKQLQALKQKQAKDAQRFQKELERQKKEQQQRLAAIAQQRLEAEKQRREELEQSWLELQQRMLEDDRIRQMSQAERDREMERRWLLLKARYGF